jgi:hypothetical protein
MGRAQNIPRLELTGPAMAIKLDPSLSPMAAGLAAEIESLWGATDHGTLNWLTLWI